MIKLFENVNFKIEHNENNLAQSDHLVFSIILIKNRTQFIT